VRQGNRSSTPDRELPSLENGKSPAPPSTGPRRRLDSWKEISAYLGRDPRTAQRWERSENLPVHRHLHSKAGSVYAFVDEIDAWQRLRSTTVVQVKPLPSLQVQPRPSAVMHAPAVTRSPLRSWLFGFCFGALVLLAIGFLYLAGRANRALVLQPLPLSSLRTDQVSPSFSPDGASIAFAVGRESGQPFRIHVKSIGRESERQITSGEAMEYSPAWSPDGKSIAYLSGVWRGPASVWLTRPDGSYRRKLFDTFAGVWPWNRGLAWMPDGKALIVMDRDPASDSGTGLFRVTLDGSKRRLTNPPSQWTDAFPSVSSDGRMLVFSRIGPGVTRVYKLRLDTNETPRLVSPPLQGSSCLLAVWFGRTGGLFTATERAGGGQLWLLPRSGAPALLTSVAGGIVDLAASANAERVTFAVRRTDANMWTVSLHGAQALSPPRLKESTASTRNEYNAQYSPDGTRIAFESDRSGPPEIWISDVDGRNAYQLTHFDGPVTGSPHWSPDSKWLTFDSRVDGHAAIFVAPAQGGAPRRITPDAGPNVVPSWSRDGKWIYFASGRSGRHQIWRVRPDGTGPVQLTKDGGFHAEEAPDGTIYYTKGRDAVTSLWRMNADGSDETEVAAPVLDRCFAVGSRGVYFASAPNPAAAPVIRFLPYGSRKSVEVVRLPQPIVYGLAISPDERELLFAQIDTRAVELFLLQGPFK
jgi:Tol biopolymer transport system component